MEVSGQLHAPLLHPWGRCPWCLLDRKLCGPYFQSGCHGEEKSFHSAINGILIILPIAHCYINSIIPTPVHLIFDKYFILIERVTYFLHSFVKALKMRFDVAAYRIQKPQTSFTKDNTILPFHL
jgi:hypothetical protein